jgi:hypothetical protein
MTSQGSILSSRPCVDRGISGGSDWSGREDSNLRPLPPEGVAPRRIRCFSAVFPGRSIPSVRRCSRLVAGRRFSANLGPCLFGGAR